MNTAHYGGKRLQVATNAAHYGGNYLVAVTEVAHGWKTILYANHEIPMDTEQFCDLLILPENNV